MRFTIWIFSLSTILYSCNKQKITDLSERYVADVEAFANNNKFLIHVNPLGDDSLYADPLTDSLKIIPLNDSIFKTWLDDPNIVELNLSHIYWQDGVSGSDPFPATFKALPYDHTKYLFEYKEKENIESFSYEIESGEGNVNEIHAESWLFTKTPEYYFQTATGYVLITLTLTDTTGVNSTIGENYFNMLIMVPNQQ